jgi:dihydrodipicolinate synthase/N-acetylneuraminate lyase
MSQPTQPRGIITAIMTPLDSAGELKREALAQLLDLQHSAGIDGVFAAGTYGEGPYLSLATKRKLVDFLADRSELPVIVHVGGAVFPEVLELTRYCNQYDNVCGIAAVGPFYFRPDELALIEFYRRIADVSAKPVYVYNNPGRQGYDIGPDSFGKIASEVRRVSGIKDTSNRLQQVQALVNRFGATHFVYGAGDETLMEQLQLGVRGHISGISNLLPEVAVGIRDSLREGRKEDAIRFQREINEVRDAMKDPDLDISPYKEILRLRGIDAGFPARPLRPLTEDERERLFGRIQPLLDALLK